MAPLFKGPKYLHFLFCFRSDSEKQFPEGSLTARFTVYFFHTNHTFHNSHGYSCSLHLCCVFGVLFFFPLTLFHICLPGTVGGVSNDLVRVNMNAEGKLSILGQRHYMIMKMTSGASIPFLS